MTTRENKKLPHSESRFVEPSTREATWRRRPGRKMPGAETFHPPGFLKNGLLQTLLASSRIRTIGNTSILRGSRCVVLKSDGGVRLKGFYTPQAHETPKGLVILLHGWEGSSDSTYIVRTGARLYKAGYDIFRLNFRDHGESHHLNQGLFFAAHLDEVFECTRKAAAFAGNRPVFLMGFSLGGSFALRIARKTAARPIPGLCRVLCISPVLDPDQSTDGADRNPLIRRYFLRKWRRSLLRKQALFPELYDFHEVVRLGSIRAMTQWLLDRYSDYGSCHDYFRLYNLVGNVLEDIPVPTTIVTAKDDPVIPVSDFYDLAPSSPFLKVNITDHGGHNGFIEGVSLRSWYEDFAIQLFNTPN
jgi:predicted alpha/beta-fold hydrolase